MRIFILLFLVFLCGISARAQFLVGPQVSYNVNDVYLGSMPVQTGLKGTASAGILFTYLPEGKKPGVRLSFNYSSLAFEEIGADYRYTYVNKGIDMQFLSHLYLKFGKFRVFVDAGPGMGYFNNPQTPAQDQSGLPPYITANLNRVYLFLTGGGGIGAELGKAHITAFGQFSYGLSKVFPRLSNFSSPYFTRIGLSLQYPIGGKD